MPHATRPPSSAHRWRRAAALLAAVVLVALLTRHALFLIVEAEAFMTPPAGTQRPDAYGAASQQLSFASGERTLRASHVPAADPAAPAVIVFHGDEEELSRWAAVQARLHAAGLTSFVFDYSGYGASTGRPTVAHLRQDALAAWGRFVALTPGAARRVALGFSLGTAVLVDAAPQLEPPPQAVVLGAGFASAREMAVSLGLVPGWAAWALPDLWNSEASIASVAPPLLIVHSRSDEFVSFRDALRLCRAARAPRRLVALDGLTHDAPLDPSASNGFWQPVIDAAHAAELRWSADAKACE